MTVLRPHRCSGCGYRWDGPLHGAELCGDCWRKAQPVLHGAPALDLDALAVETLAQVKSALAKAEQSYRVYGPSACRIDCLAIIRAALARVAGDR